MCTQVHILALSLLRIDIVVYIGTLDIQNGTLHGSVFLQVIYHLGHDGGRDGKPVTAIGTCLWVEHGIDTYQLTIGVYQCTTRVTCVDGGVCLNETLNTVGS